MTGVVIHMNIVERPMTIERVMRRLYKWLDASPDAVRCESIDSAMRLVMDVEEAFL